MIIQCPDCHTKLKPKPPLGTREGAKVVVKCPCGTPLRFTMPGKPRSTSSALNAFTETIFGSMGRHA